MEKSCRKCALRPLFNFAIKAKTVVACKTFFKSKTFYQKAFKKLSLFFLSSAVPFKEQSYQRQKGSGTGDRSLFRLQNEFRKIPLFVVYYMTKFDHVM